MITCTRTSRNGQTYAYPAAHALDGDPATLVDLYATASSYTYDFLTLDLGAAATLGGVVVRNVHLSPPGAGIGCYLQVYSASGPTDSPVPDNLLAASPASPSGLAGVDVALSFPAASIARYLLIGLVSNSASQMGVLGELILTVAVPTLTATASLPGNVPTILLAGN